MNKIFAIVPSAYRNAGGINWLSIFNWPRTEKKIAFLSFLYIDTPYLKINRHFNINILEIITGRDRYLSFHATRGDYKATGSSKNT